MRQRQNAANLVDDFRYRIRVQMPHPIAYRWREVEASLSNSDGYARILDCAEVALCYTAQLAIVAVRGIGEPPPKWVGQMAARLAEQGKGTNFGDWLSILREVEKNQKLKQRQDLPFYELTSFLADSVVDSAVQRLKRQRDAHSHGRGPRDHEVPAAFESALHDLAVLMQGIEFLSEYPLRYVENVRRDTIANKTHYEYRDLMGDHPLVPVQRDVVSAFDLESGSLYSVDRSGRLYLLRPFLVRRQCAECSNWSTFSLDYYIRKTDETWLKSLEHNHTFCDTNISSAFRSVGLLPSIGLTSN